MYQAFDAVWNLLLAGMELSGSGANQFYELVAH